MKLHNLFKLFEAGVLLMALSMVPASASTIVGSLPLSGFNVTQDGGDLLVSTFVSAVFTRTTGPGIGNYSVIPTLTNFGSTTLTLTNILDGGGFKLAEATWGTFIATSGQFTFHDASEANVVLLGTFTPGLPGAGCSICTVTGTIARVSINQSGGSLSEAITIESSPSIFPSVPEPATMTLFGSALVGLGLFGRKRSAR